MTPATIAVDESDSVVPTTSAAIGDGPSAVLRRYGNYKYRLLENFVARCDY
jgi:hypothetical protein